MDEYFCPTKFVKNLSVSTRSTNQIGLVVILVLFILSGSLFNGNPSIAQLSLRVLSDQRFCSPRRRLENLIKEMSTQEGNKNTRNHGAQINLTVKGQDGKKVVFTIHKSTQLTKLMKTYCTRQKFDFNAVVFLFDGRRLRGEQTPNELVMEDGDEIDAMLHQTSGSCV